MRFLEKVVQYSIIFVDLHLNFTLFLVFVLFYWKFSLLDLCKVDGIRANYSGLAISLSDICMKPLDKDCATQSVLQVEFFRCLFELCNKLICSNIFQTIRCLFFPSKFLIKIVFFLFITFWRQYFKMDPDNYDNYGGVEHLKYCFEVLFLYSSLCFLFFKCNSVQLHRCLVECVVLTQVVS